MSGRIYRHRLFLKSVVHNLKKNILNASNAELGTLIELIYNASKLSFSAHERRTLMRHLTTLKMLGRIRSAQKAREMLLQHGSVIVPIIIASGLSLAGLV